MRCEFTQALQKAFSVVPWQTTEQGVPHGFTAALADARAEGRVCIADGAVGPEKAKKVGKFFQYLMIREEPAVGTPLFCFHQLLLEPVDLFVKILHRKAGRGTIHTVRTLLV